MMDAFRAGFFALTFPQLPSRRPAPRGAMPRWRTGFMHRQALTQPNIATHRSSRRPAPRGVTPRWQTAKKRT